MTERLKQYFQNESFILWAAFFAYITLTVTSLAFYEPWRDEADSWLVARDMSVPQLFHHLQYMGHQSLWYLILMPFAKLGLPYITMHIIHLAIIYAVVYVFLFHSPFPKLTKIFFIFSFFIAFEYAIVARNYSISILLLFLIATLFPKRFERPFLYSLMVFLLFHTNVLNLAGAGLFLGEFILGVLRKRERWHYGYVLPIFFMLFGAVAAIYQLYPTEPDVSKTLQGWYSYVNIAGSIRASISSMLGGTDYHQLVFSSILSMLIIAIFIILIDKDKKILLFFILSFGWLIYIFTFKYPGFMRHHGFILIYIVVSYWLMTYSVANTLSERQRKQFITLLTAVLMYLSIVSFVRHYDSMTHTTSGGKEAAEYIIKNGYINDTIIADYSEYGSSILTYLRDVSPDKKLWFAYRREFGSYSHLDNRFYTQYGSPTFQKKSLQHALTYAEELPKDNVLLVLNYPLNDPGQYDLYEVYNVRSISRPDWNPTYQRSESFWLYKFN